jgi:hypothetical protein
MFTDHAWDHGVKGTALDDTTCRMEDYFQLVIANGQFYNDNRFLTCGYVPIQPVKQLFRVMIL